MSVFSKQAKWIGQPGATFVSWQAKVLPSPFFRKVFTWDAKRQDAKILICGLGYYELYLNGRKVGDQVLDPVVTQYDKRVRYVVHDVAEYLVPGENVMGVILGNGWYNCHTPEVWHFDKASWRDCPKMLFQLNAEDDVILVSDASWKCSSGPIVFDGLRNGETYDARLELGDWLSPDYDDSAWKGCVQVNPPGGVLQEQTMPPCKVMETIAPVDQWRIGYSVVYDFWQNISGWVRLRVKGQRGATIRIAYGERLTHPDRSVDQTHISKHVLVEQGQFQTDRYTLKGGEEEVWEPRFTYHGFQYAQVFIDGEAELLGVEARFVHTAFARIGRFSCSDETANRLQDCTARSYKGNFVGIPTDCPHREKNGWTGDAQLASEMGLWNFDAASSYAHWLDSFADVQRPSGQLPGIVPSCGWGYNWGSGPAWDSAFLIIAWNVYLHTGDSSTIKTHYDAMRRYVDYCTSMADGDIVSFGLGDWAPVDWKRITDPALTSTGYYYLDCQLLAKFAALTGREDDQKAYTALATNIKKAFNRRFYKGDGVYAKGEQTALGCALYQGLVEDSEKAAVVKRLVASVEATGGKLDFGILGAKYVPRALADNGHADLAFKLLTQRGYPGWGHWLEKGSSTLWESWLGTSSLNHIMFGDISAWFYQYLAGIAPDPELPGFKHVIVNPRFVSGVDWVKAEHVSPFGAIRVAWERRQDGFNVEIHLPENTTATVTLPGSKAETLEPGTRLLLAKG